MSVIDICVKCLLNVDKNDLGSFGDINDRSTLGGLPGHMGSLAGLPWHTGKINDGFALKLREALH